MTVSRYRGSLAVWALLLAYASLYPFFPLRPPTPEAIAGFFLTPRYIVRADIAFNVVAYVPFGTLGASRSPRPRASPPSTAWRWSSRSSSCPTASLRSSTWGAMPPARRSGRWPSPTRSIRW